MMQIKVKGKENNMKKCMKCGEKKTLYYVGNDAFASPIYYCKDCKGLIHGKNYIK